MANAKNSPEMADEATDKITTEPNGASTKNSKQKCRHRASVACASCRDRRIRCVVPEGETECTQCKRSGVECIIRNDDERRRPISRAYMCSLTERVALLEGMLQEQGAAVPPANHPPMTRHGPRLDEPSPASKNRKAQPNTLKLQDNSSPGSLPDDFMDGENNDMISHRGEDNESAHSANSPSMLPPPQKDGMVSRLLSTRGHLSFDQLSGRLRYFGPTTNCHVHSGQATLEDSRETLEQSRRTEKVIRFLSDETYDYLMDLFWTFYNSVLHVLHKDAFYEDKENGGTQFYSGFLHICVLAMGFRFADKSRPDIQKISINHYESTLHREAKYMLDAELERPGGIPLVVALLLLGDLECMVGRDNTGWLYSGMAVRISFDIGLHLDAMTSGLPEREVEIRRMTLWACVIYDKYWALFLGRPTSMKSSDLEVSRLAKQFERLGTCLPAGPENALETQIYEALLDLMELAGKITENLDPRSQTDANIDREAYLRMAALDREFGNWYQRLPEKLKWKPSNINNAPFSFFVLHQQYHAALILLHRPFAMYEDPNAGETMDGQVSDNHFSALSRTVCTKHAIRVARIFWQHRQRFETRHLCVTGLQHAGTAATALVAALAYIKDSNDRHNNMQYLDCLTSSLHDLAYTYQPAERMYLVLQAVTAELRGNPLDADGFRRPKGVMVPARRPSNMAEDMDPPSFVKRRHVARTHSRSKVSPARRPSSSYDHIDPSLADSLHRKRSDASSFERPDSFVMVTPQSDIASWHTLSTEPVPTPGTLPPNFMSKGSNANNMNTWMGSDLDAADIGHLATVHFPELRDIPDLGGGGADSEPVNSHLDFMNLGGDDWIGKDWGQPTHHHGHQTLGTGELDGFPPMNTFAMTPGKFEQALNANFGTAEA